MQFQRTKPHKFHVPVDIECILVPLVKRLLADNADGDAFQTAIRPFFSGERPRMEIFDGNNTMFIVEGPTYVFEGRTWPLGGQLLTSGGWMNLDPLQTRLLQDHLKSAIDAAVFRWVINNSMFLKARVCRQARKRPFDDQVALRQIVDAAHGKELESGEPNA